MKVRIVESERVVSLGFEPHAGWRNWCEAKIEWCE